MSDRIFDHLFNWGNLFTAAFLCTGMYVILSPFFPWLQSGELQYPTPSTTAVALVLVLVAGAIIANKREHRRRLEMVEEKNHLLGCLLGPGITQHQVDTVLLDLAKKVREAQRREECSPTTIRSQGDSPREYQRDARADTVAAEAKLDKVWRLAAMYGPQLNMPFINQYFERLDTEGQRDAA